VNVKNLEQTSILFVYNSATFHEHIFLVNSESKLICEDKFNL